MNSWRLPTHVLVEAGALTRLGTLTRDRVGGDRALVVADPGLASTPWPLVAEESLVEAGYQVVVDREVEPNPRVATAERLGALAVAADIDVVVAIGGGSVLDAAKAAAMLATNPRPVLDLVGREKFTRPPLPFVACPTTCGTGSEVTWVSVLSDPESGSKVSVKGMGMFPQLAVVDPDALRTLPRSLLATTAMDALTHAIEATTCRVANPVSDVLAEQAIRLIFERLPACWDDPTDGAARHDIALASTVAGMAFGNADVATVHCLSEAIGGLLDLPHGLVNAALLAPTLRYEGAAVVARLAALERALGGERGLAPEELAEHFITRVETLCGRVEVPAAATLGVGPEHWERLAELAVANGSNASSPRAMDHDAYRELLRSAFGPEM